MWMDGGVGGFGQLVKDWMSEVDGSCFSDHRCLLGKTTR